MVSRKVERVLDIVLWVGAIVVAAGFAWLLVGLPSGEDRVLVAVWVVVAVVVLGGLYGVGVMLSRRR